MLNQYRPRNEFGGFMREIIIFVAATVSLSVSLTHAQQPAKKSWKAVYSEAAGIGKEEGVMRRDPSDIIKVGDLYYVWYSKGTISSGYDATVWYSTSPDGRKWTEQGMALAKGKPDTWEGASVFTPNILVAEGRYWLFYTGTSRDFHKSHSVLIRKSASRFPIHRMDLGNGWPVQIRQ